YDNIRNCPLGFGEKSIHIMAPKKSYSKSTIESIAVKKIDPSPFSKV
ncbi:hypothetical protein MHK_006118, partial [Candidatus Magnetomorum sp. HK-1]